MKSKAIEYRAIIIAFVVLTISVGALAQDWSRREKKFSGVINAYTPQTTSASGAVVGPYEVRGPWSLTLKRDSTRADFSAALNMEFSDGWVLTHNTAAPVNFDPTTRGAHTHHITLVDGEVTQITNPNGFQVTGTAIFTLNGGSAPVTVSPSPVVIQITGGSEVEFSNITLTFQSPGSNHFGADPLPGVVRTVREERTREPW